MLEQLTALLAATVVVVPLFKLLGVGTVLGYLVAGMLLGSRGLHLVTDVELVKHISELGVVMLMFVIGLELHPSRLWTLRRSVLGLGSAQVLGTTLVVSLLALHFGLSGSAAAIIGFAASMSSTAFVLQTLAERDELKTRHGRDSFSILLFQDLAIIPLLAALPLLAPATTADSDHDSWLNFTLGLSAIVAMTIIGRPLLRWVFRLIARHGNRELFTTMALLVVFGTALLMTWVQLSMSLGTFLAGVLLADSEYRHEINAELEPFKGLLLGLFFIAVGMSINLGLVTEQPGLLLEMAICLCAIKFSVLYGVGRLSRGGTDSARDLGVALAGGGEFAFVLLGLSAARGILPRETADLFVAVVTLSMMFTPLLFLLNDKVFRPWLKQEDEPEYDLIDEPGNPVVIAGFGRFGQIISRILRMHGMHFTALENSATHIDFVRKFGNRIYYGDATRRNLLESARVEQAKLFVIAIGNVETSLKIVKLLRAHYPHLPIYARARNRFHCHKLMDFGVTVLQRDTLLSSLAMAKEVLYGLGISKSEADRSVALFQKFDEDLLRKQHAIHHDEAALIQSATQAVAELRSLFEADTSLTKDQTGY
ncbi:MAG: monovalent cation:proton antiporter-2 (CPA2) family protein [Gammaproteobacteria bacterium]